MKTQDTVIISKSSAEGLSKIGPWEIYEVETPEKMAWILLLLKKLEDNPEWFPRGKWATIQNIEHQLDLCTNCWLKEIM